MVHAIIHHKVKDFDAWLPAFRAHDAVRKQYGCLSAQVRRSEADPNDVVIDFEWRSSQGWQDFAQKSDLRTVMDRAGVIGEPEITLVSEPIPWER